MLSHVCAIDIVVSNNITARSMNRLICLFLFINVIFLSE